MTDVAPTTVQAGNTVTLGRLHVEILGNVAASSVEVTAYLSTNPAISGADHEIGSFSWGNFPGTAAWRNGIVTMQMLLKHARRHQRHMSSSAAPRSTFGSSGRAGRSPRARADPGIR